MKTENFTPLGFTIGALATGSGTDFIDDAHGGTLVEALYAARQQAAVTFTELTTLATPAGSPSSGWNHPALHDRMIDMMKAGFKQNRILR